MPPYVADPHFPDAAISVLAFPSATVPESGDSSFWLRVGGRFGLLRRHPGPPGGRRWQLSLDVGIDAIFDHDYSLDNLGWDGNYGLSLATASTSRWTWRIGLLHTSSHLGDEYIERTGRRRLGYTREEIVGGTACRLGSHYRAYGEVGWFPSPRVPAIQDPWRLQAGLEWQRPPRGRSRLGPYWAVDVSALEELGWEPDVAVQAGWWVPSGDRTWRLGAEIYDGRTPLGELYRFRQTHLAVGLWADL